jgi:hypothetical protein
MQMSGGGGAAPPEHAAALATAAAAAGEVVAGPARAAEWLTLSSQSGLFCPHDQVRAAALVAGSRAPHRTPRRLGIILRRPFARACWWARRAARHQVRVMAAELAHALGPAAGPAADALVAALAGGARFAARASQQLTACGSGAVNHALWFAPLKGALWLSSRG